MVSEANVPARTLLVLDLDETLIHASERPLSREADLTLFGYHVYLRPNLAHFLAECARRFDLAIWSSASDDYVEAVVDHLFPRRDALKFVWGRSRATLRRHILPDEAFFYVPADHRNYLKPLKKVVRRGWRLERILIVDDTPEKCVRNYGNAIYVRPYEGEAEDTELTLLAAYLGTLADCPNVRKVEKRSWRNQVTREI